MYVDLKNVNIYCIFHFFDGIWLFSLGVVSYLPEYKSKKRKRQDPVNTSGITSPGFGSSSSES